MTHWPVNTSMRTPPDARPEDDDHLRKLEMPEKDARAFAAALPLYVAQVEVTSHPTLRMDGERNVDLIIPAFLANIIWELRQALLFNTRDPAERGAGIRLHRDMGPEIFQRILDHTPLEAWEAAWRLETPLQPLLNAVLADLGTTIVCLRRP